jgi:hypothetical protein
VAAAKGRLFAVDSGTLYDIDPDTGAYQDLGASWNSQHLVGLGAHLYAFEESGKLYRIEV